MILHEAAEKLRMVSQGSGCGDAPLMYAPLPAHHICRFCTGTCLGTEYGGRVAEISSPEPFPARMRLDDLYGAPLKSGKTRAAAAGALTAAAGFLMLTRKLSACPPECFDACLAGLVSFCGGRSVYVIGQDIPGIRQALFPEEADLILATGDAVYSGENLFLIDEARALGKEILFTGPEWSGTAALLGLSFWCPHGT
jgi:hypothetical protein